MIKFTWDGKGRFLDNVKLKAAVIDVKKALQSMTDYRERLSDEIKATKDIYFAILKHCTEIETWLRLLGIHVRCLKTFIHRSNQIN